MSKGSRKRKCLTSRDEEDIRWALYRGHITTEEFDERLKEIRKCQKD